MTPIRAPRGKVVHAVELAGGAKTVCGKAWRGWVIVPEGVTCRRCKMKMVWPVE